MFFSKLSSFFTSWSWPAIAFAALCFVIAVQIMLPGSRSLAGNFFFATTVSVALLLLMICLMTTAWIEKRRSRIFFPAFLGAIIFVFTIGLVASSFIFVSTYEGTVVLPNGDPKEAYSLQRFESCIAAPWEKTIISPFQIQKSTWLPLKTGDGEVFGASIWYEGDPATLYRTYGKPEVLFSTFEQECARTLAPLLLTANGKRAKTSLNDKCAELASIDDTLQRLAQEYHLTCSAL